MTSAQKLAVRLSELTTRINELNALDDLTEEQRNELDGIRTEYATKAAQHRAALTLEGEEEARMRGDFPAGGNGGDGEGAEVRALLGRVRARPLPPVRDPKRNRRGAARAQRSAQAPTGRQARRGCGPVGHASHCRDAGAQRGRFRDARVHHHERERRLDDPTADPPGALRPWCLRHLGMSRRLRARGHERVVGDLRHISRRRRRRKARPRVPRSPRPSPRRR